MKVRKNPKRLAVTCGVLLTLGAAVALLRSRGRSARPAVLVSDVLFAQGSAFLIWGLIRALGNVHMFDSARWGLKQLRAVYRNRIRHGPEERDAYLKWRAARPHHDDVAVLLVTAAALLTASLLSALLAGT